MLRKSLGFLLALCLLCAVAGVGASAAALEDEARVLLARTLATLKSDTYTLITTGGYKVFDKGITIADKDRYMLEYELDSSRKVEQWILGSHRRDIYLPGKSYHVYPDRGFYYRHDQDYEGTIFPTILPSFLTQNLERADMNAISAELVTRNGKRYVAAYVPTSDTHTMAFHYLDGQLKQIDIIDARGTQPFVTISEFTPTIDVKVFEPKGIRVPEKFFYFIKDRMLPLFP